MQAEQHRILVVDDNQATLYATSRVLKAAGFQVLTAATGTEAVETACAAEPDLIVLDVNLPDFDGFEVVRRIRAVPAIARVPIIHLSATFVQDAYKVHGLEGGANGYLTHPVEPPVLVASINALLRTRYAEDAMRRSEDRLKAIFDRALDGIALLDQDFIFLDVNPALCCILGHPREEFVGKHASALCPEGFENEVGKIAEIVSREGAWRGELPLLKSDGTRVELEWSISIHSDPDLRLAIVSDITERMAIAAEHELLLQRESAARGEAERANRLKDEFLATLSHELRSPLNAIVGWTQVLQRRTVDGGLPIDELTDALAIIERNARLQTQLIADLLDVSRITSGKMRLEIAPLDPTGPLEAAIEGVRPAAEARQIRLELEIDHHAGPVLADPARLQQIFWNLLSNAVKFTPREGTVWARLVRENSHVVVTVRDTGCGIHADFVPFVFDRFRQEHTSTQRNYGGLGLGLAIVRHLVEMHGGTVQAASDGEGRGATFTVYLPRSDPRSLRRLMSTEHEESSATTRSAPEVSFEGLRVLIVDDDADSRELLGRVLSDRGAEVHIASSAAQALQIASWAAPRVLVSDIGMPGEDGYSLIRALRQRGFSPAELQAIAVTALARVEDRQKGLAAGYDTFFVKPIDIAALVETVDSLARRTSPAAPSTPASPQ
jgi:PAS domain S-box-containing protein